jgi:erythromycin esterase-like protein
MLSFVDWLRGHNAGLPEAERYARGAGFYGMDVYSLHASGGSAPACRPACLGGWLHESYIRQPVPRGA